MQSEKRVLRAFLKQVLTMRCEALGYMKWLKCKV